jgi:hypothetical protein
MKLISTTSFFFFFLFSFYFNNACAQDAATLLNNCKKEATEGHFKKAFHQFKPIAQKQTKDFDVQWYAAKLAYWNWDIAAAKKFYKQALSLKKEHLYVRLDYAKMMVDIGEYATAIPLLKQYIAFDKWSVDAEKYLVKALYYKGNLAEALKVIDQMPDYMQQEKEIAVLKKEIEEQHAVYYQLGFDYASDDQPLKKATPNLLVSRKQSALFNWQLGGTYHSFVNEHSKSNAYVVEVGNRFHFDKLKQVLQLHLGLSNLSDAGKTEMTGGVQWFQKIEKHFMLELSAERKPYFYSLASTHATVVYDNYAAAFSFDNFKKFSGKIQVQQQQFNDGNKIANYSAWMLSPPLKLKWVIAKVGYSFQYADAASNHYTPTISVDSFLVNYDSTKQIPGVYAPYFTPAHQTIHAALLWIEIKPFKKLTLTCNANFPITAKLDNPYFFLNKDNSNAVFLDKNYATLNYQPANYKAELSYRMSPKLQLGLGYEYLKTNYYEANYFHVHLLAHGF